MITRNHNATSNYTPAIEAIVHVDEWMRHFAFQRIVANRDSYGPFLPATIGAVADANYAFLTNHYSTSTTGAAALLSPDGSKSEVPALREWITNRYNYLTGQLATVNAPFEISNNGGNNFTTSQSNIVLFGKAPIEAAFIRVNATATPGDVDGFDQLEHFLGTHEWAKPNHSSGLRPHE